MERVEDGSVGDVAVQEVALARKPDAPRLRALLDLVHERRLADAGQTGHEQNLGSARANPTKHLVELFSFAVAAVHLATKEEAVRQVIATEVEGRDGIAPRLPLASHLLQIGLERFCRLIAPLGHFREELPHDVGQDLGDRRIDHRGAGAGRATCA